MLRRERGAQDHPRLQTRARLSGRRRGDRVHGRFAAVRQGKYRFDSLIVSVNYLVIRNTASAKVGR